MKTWISWTLKRIVTSVLIIAMLIGTINWNAIYTKAQDREGLGEKTNSQTVLSSENNSSVDDDENGGITPLTDEKSYVIDELDEYLGGLGYDSNSEVMLSQKYNINEAENKSNIYFVKVDNESVGAITVSEYRGEQVSAFLFGEKAFEELENGEKAVVVSSDEKINICTKEDKDILTGKRIKDNNYKKKKIRYSDITEKISIEDKYDYKSTDYTDNNDIICND